MGIDLYLKKPECDKCGHQEEGFSAGYTYNVAAMWYAIYPDAEGMVDIENMPLGEAEDRLRYAIKELKRRRAEMIKMEPPNAWGSYNGFLDFLHAILQETIKAEDSGAVWGAWR